MTSSRIWNICKNYAALSEVVSQAPILACLPARKGMPGNHIHTGSYNLLRKQEMKRISNAKTSFKNWNSYRQENILIVLVIV